MDSAGMRVSNTFELLEMILLKVPSRTVLLAQRVSKKWHSTINRSKKLQRILFVEPVDSIKTASLYSDPIFQAWKKTRKKDFDCRITGVIPNPMIAPFFAAMDGTMRALTRDLCIKDLKEELPKSWLAPTASWRRMVLSQPPVRPHFNVIVGNETMGYATSHFKMGLTRLGDIVDRINAEYAVQAPEFGHKYVCLLGDWHWNDVDMLDELEIACLL